MITPGKNGQMQEQIDFSKTSQICCESCGGSTFKQTLLIKKDVSISSTKRTRNNNSNASICL